MMKILYITRLDIPIEKEHVFIKTVWEELSKFDGTELLTILFKDIPFSSLSFAGELKAWTLAIPTSIRPDHETIIREIRNAFGRIVPHLIHSNMQEGFELTAALQLKIPAITTIHIGSVMCPQGGNGLLTADDRICDGKIGEKCITCCCGELPCPSIAKAVLRFTPPSLKKALNDYFNRHQTFYLSRLFNIENSLADRQRYMADLADHHPIAANRNLYELLQKHYRCVPLLIPHGVKERERIALPPTNDKIRFYYVGRISHQKGLHIAIEAFRGIDSSLYEFHIIGEPNNGRKNRMYFQDTMRKLKGINGFFHGYVENSEFDTYVKDWHVMIHPAICHEIYGLTISEALSTGRPVLATRCCGSEMQIQDERNGWLIPTNDIEAMRIKIMEILDKKDRLRDFSDRCRLPHEISDYIRELITNYKQIINEHAK